MPFVGVVEDHLTSSAHWFTGLLALSRFEMIVVPEGPVAQFTSEHPLVELTDIEGFAYDVLGHPFSTGPEGVSCHVYLD